MRRRVCLLFGTLCMLMMCSCGFGENLPEETGITVKSDLSIEALIIDEFDESAYSVSELQNMMQSEAAEYSALHGAGSVEAGSATVTEGKIRVPMSYADADSYAEFNNRYLTIAPLEEVMAGKNPGIAFSSVKDGEIVDLSTIEDADKLCMLVTDETGMVSCPGKIMYISDGIETLSRTQVRVTEGMDGLAYIIFKNK